MEEIRVLDLLERYKRWVSNGDIQFLTISSDEQSAALKCVQELISEFQNATNKAKKEKEAERKGNLSEFLDWNKTHKIGVELWHSLASSALKDIDAESKGNSKLFEFLDAATDFEDLLYGLEQFYRDHTLHSLWVYFLGEYILRDHLRELHENLDWYLFNDIESEKDKYEYGNEVVAEAKRKEEEIREDIDEHKDAIWCIMALCHDLGYSLAKLEKLNEKVQAVLKFYDVTNFKYVGYSLDLEHQYLLDQFLQIMAMDVRIVPSEEHRNKEIDVKERVLVKCYRDDSIYWDLCKALEKKQHGILSSYLIYKVLSMFAGTSVRGPAEVWGLDSEEAAANVISGNILYAMALHTLDFNYLDRLGSLSDILILADELEEFSRLGRQLLSRKYNDTMARCEIKLNKKMETKDLAIDITYQVYEHHSLGDFFVKKAERLCRIYSLEPDREKERGWGITSVKITTEKKDKKLFFLLDADPSKTKGHLPKAKINRKPYAEKDYDLVCQEDKIYVKKDEINIRKWFKNLNDPKWKNDGLLE